MKRGSCCTSHNFAKEFSLAQQNSRKSLFIQQKTLAQKDFSSICTLFQLKTQGLSNTRKEQEEHKAKKPRKPPKWNGLCGVCLPFCFVLLCVLPTFVRRCCFALSPISCPTTGYIIRVGVFEARLGPEWINCHQRSIEDVNLVRTILWEKSQNLQRPRWATNGGNRETNEENM
jgi:hypothetical protein